MATVYSLAFACLHFNHFISPIAIAPNYPLLRLDERSKKVGKKLMNQPWLTIVGIAIGSLVIDAPQSWAVGVSPGESNRSAYYAYHQPDELIETLQKQEQKIDCQAAKSDRSVHFQTWVNRGIALQKHRKYRQSLSCFERAIALQSQSEQAWYRRGIALSHLKQYTQAAFSYQQAIEINNFEHTSWYNQGNAYKHLGNYERAISAYQQAIVLKPDFHAAHYQLGKVLSQIGQFERAVNAYQEATYINPEYNRAWYSQGALLYKLKRYDEAIAVYQKALKYNPEQHRA